MLPMTHIWQESLRGIKLALQHKRERTAWMGMTSHVEKSSSNGGGDGRKDEGSKRKRSIFQTNDSEDDCGGGSSPRARNQNVEALKDGHELFGSDQGKRKWTRLLLRELYDLGYAEAAACLEREAAICVQSGAMETLQTHIQAHHWDAALQFLSKASTIKMRSTAALREVQLLLLKRKYVDLLLQRQLREALVTLQQEIVPHFDLREEHVQELAVLLLCNEEQQIQCLANLLLDDGQLLAHVETLVSADEIVPQGAIRRMIRWEENERPEHSPLGFTQQLSLECIGVLLKHNQEVHQLEFSPDGRYLASVSQDAKIIIWSVDVLESEDAKSGTKKIELKSKVLHVLKCLDGTPECIAWSPDSRSLLSCGGDETSVIQLWNPLTGRRGRRFQHPTDSVSVIRWLPNGNQFLSGSVEKSLVLWNVDDGSMVYQWGGRRILDIAMHPDGIQFIVLTSDVEVHAYNLQDKSDRSLLRSDHLISCIEISQSVASGSKTDQAQYLLLNLIENQDIACLDLSTEVLTARFKGIKQDRYILRPSFSGYYNELIVSGSEDGSVHCWRREDGKLMATVHSHSSVVNVVRTHPVHRHLLASASDDETIRFWRIQSR
ncbi:hypothetical protein Poli38472_008552 [Pythium oligandrum]|uniref:Uncharacterized protein n=1 Tax=Pythium oligandrum TaxID=41045 RepID=A0A8K1FCK1_PYTOL|nr:hypothetical protein Poli38472_008552 [Pythium oligandrum]|eukprot:TMW55904.1 hypothetical protein Poli38472_008552 [Pythium oligandrum]